MAAEQSQQPELTDKQRAFVEFYCSHRNGARAARQAGYSERSDRSIASELLRKPEIRAAIEQHFAELVMGPREVLASIQDIATASMNDFVKGNQVDLKRAAQRGKLPVLKTVRETKYGLSIQLHDRLAALKLLGEAYGLFRPGPKGTEDDPIHQVSMTVDQWKAVAQERRRQAEAALDDDEDSDA